MLGANLKSYRLDQSLTIKEVAAALAIDPSLLSRIEHEERRPSEDQVRELANLYQLDAQALLKDWVSDKVYEVLNNYPDLAPDVLKAMETRIAYLAGPKAMLTQAVSDKLTEELKQIDELRNKWNAQRPAKGLQLKKLNESFGVNYTFESNKIEGNTLSLQETYMVINDGLTIAGKSVQEHLEAINHDEAIEFVRELASNKLPLTEYRLKQIHNLVLKGLDRKNAGVYRSVPVRITGSSHLPPEPYLVPKLMEELFVFYNTEKERMHAVLLAAEMHERLVTVHPFIDGNGRTARLLMNLILLRNGYTIAILKGNNQDRLTYYQALQAVQEDANTTPFYHLITGAVKTSLQEHLSLV
jgi:Fic family protein